MKVSHSRLKRNINLSQAQQLFAQERETIETAFPGDVIGLNNPGTGVIIGATLLPICVCALLVVTLSLYMSPPL